MQTKEATTAELVTEGRDALLAGDKARARALLQRAVRDEPDNVEGWLWLSGTHAQPEEIAYCLQQVLLRDPNNPQALEGMDWLAQTALAAQPPAQSAGEPIAASPGTRAATNTSSPPALMAAQRSPLDRSDKGLLWESALHVSACGALLGLLRLLGALRPGTLLLLRGARGPIGAPGAVALALLAAGLHALALLIVWIVLSRGIARMRDDRRGDQWDSLVHAGHIFVPGYLLLLGLGLSAAGLGWSDRRWLPFAVLIWLVILASGGLMLRRLLRLLESLHFPPRQRLARLAWLVLPALLAALLGLGAAGAAVQGLLRGL